MFERILLVCTGNICRSPMAEGLLKHALTDKDSHFLISSAGLSAVVDSPATPLAQSFLHTRNIDISSHRARQLTASLVVDAELILVMEMEQKKQLERLYPYAYGKVFLLGKWSHFEIPDPYGGSLLVYEKVLALLEMGLKDWQKKICAI